MSISAKTPWSPSGSRRGSPRSPSAGVRELGPRRSARARCGSAALAGARPRAAAPLSASEASAADAIELGVRRGAADPPRRTADRADRRGRAGVGWSKRSSATAAGPSRGRSGCAARRPSANRGRGRGNARARSRPARRPPSTSPSPRPARRTTAAPRSPAGSSGGGPRDAGALGAGSRRRHEAGRRGRKPAALASASARTRVDPVARRASPGVERERCVQEPEGVDGSERRAEPARSASLRLAVISPASAHMPQAIETARDRAAAALGERVQAGVGGRVGALAGVAGGARERGEEDDRLEGRPSRELEQMARAGHLLGRTRARASCGVGEPPRRRRRGPPRSGPPRARPLGRRPAPRARPVADVTGGESTVAPARPVAPRAPPRPRPRAPRRLTSTSGGRRARRRVARHDRAQPGGAAGDERRAAA